jgi:hypothetical protein
MSGPRAFSTLRFAVIVARAVTLVLALVALLVLPASAAASSKSSGVTFAGEGAVGSVTVKCKHGERATGGGFLMTPTSLATNVHLLESQKVGQRSWRVSSQRFGPGLSRVTAIVYCSKTGPKTTTKSSSGALAANAITRVSASCGSAGKAQAGGTSVPPAASEGLGVIESFRSAGKTWRSSAEAFIDTPTLTTYVYCAKVGALKSRTGSAPATANASLDSATALSPRCKDGKPLAGGFSQPTAFIGGGFNTRFRPYESVRSSKQWRASGVFLGNTLAPTLNAIAYCH